MYRGRNRGQVFENERGDRPKVEFTVGMLVTHSVAGSQSEGHRQDRQEGSHDESLDDVPVGTAQMVQPADHVGEPRPVEQTSQ